ncbi:rod shape-determining protein MreC [Anaerolineales bacterium HSG25]|nr:rod shape-determining protein MreC [Anaerolineales bacterium HSG25]
MLDQLGYLTSFRTNLQSAISPIQQSITLTVEDLVGQTTLPTDVVVLQNRVTELETVNNTLVVENVRLREIERENEQLRQLLNYTRSNPQTNYQPSTVIGRSIGVDPTNLLYFVYVDVGARDGIARNMPVITDRGLVGRVVAVGPNSAQVLMLIDPASAINAITQNSRATGVVRGNIDGTLIMDRIPQGDTISPGDIVLSSGLGGNFPNKLVIGQVTEVLQRDQDLFQTARVRPTVDFGKLETLLMITSFEPIDFEAELLNQREDDN